MRTDTGQTRTGRGRVGGEDGAAAVEFAFVGTLFLMLLFAIITFGLVFAMNHTLSHAASEGARSALVAAPGTTTETAQNAAATRMDWLGSGGTVQATVAPCEDDSTRECVRVVTTYDYATYPLVPPLPGFGLVIPDQMSRSATVQITQVAP